MARLALAAGEDAQFMGDSVLLPLDRRAGDAAARTGGEIVLVYRIVPRSLVTFLGRGRIAALEYRVQGGPVVCRIEDYRDFASPEVSGAEAAVPRAARMLLLSDERFTEILDRSMAPATLPAAEEAAAPFVSTYLTIRDQVLKAWSYRCAVTSARFTPPEATSRLEVIAIRPRELGGPLHVRNCLPLVPIAARAWQQGWIAAGPQFDILAVQNRLEPDLLERMWPDGRLLVPDNPMLMPDPRHIAYHREHVFAH